MYFYEIWGISRLYGPAKRWLNFERVEIRVLALMLLAGNGVAWWKYAL